MPEWLAMGLEAGGGEGVGGVFMTPGGRLQTECSQLSVVPMDPWMDSWGSQSGLCSDNWAQWGRPGWC